MQESITEAFRYCVNRVEAKKYILIFAIIVSAGMETLGQDNFYNSQYFQAGPLINPAFTGIENFLDVKLNYRNQWSGFDDAPSTNFIGISGYLQKETQQAYKQYALRTSNPYYLDSIGQKGIPLGERLRHGIGGNVVYDVQGPFEQISGYVNYALHVPVSKKIKLSIGVSGRVINQRYDLEKIVLHNPDADILYRDLIAAGGKSTFFSLNPGLSIYSNKFYFSYAAQNIYRTPLSSDEIVADETPLSHIVMAGIRVGLSRDVSLLPSIFISQNEDISNAWDANLKVLIKERAWAGLSYRSNETLVIMGGIYINNLINLSYSYDYVMNELNNYTNGSHELILGLMLFKKDTKAPFLW